MNARQVAPIPRLLLIKNLTGDEPNLEGAVPTVQFGDQVLPYQRRPSLGDLGAAKALIRLSEPRSTLTSQVITIVWCVQETEQQAELSRRPCVYHDKRTETWPDRKLPPNFGPLLGFGFDGVIVVTEKTVDRVSCKSIAFYIDSARVGSVAGRTGRAFCFLNLRDTNRAASSCI